MDSDTMLNGGTIADERPQHVGHPDVEPSCAVQLVQDVRPELVVVVEVVDQVVGSLEFSGLAKYAFGLAQKFNAFYHRYPILNEEDVHRKRWRAAGVAYFRTQLTVALDLMGIEVPTRM